MQLRALRPCEDEATARRLVEVQRAAYEVEARLLGDDRIPPLGETVEDLRRAPLLWVGAYDDDEDLVAGIAWTVEPEGLDVARLVVAPAAHRRGFGSALVRHVLSLAGGRPVVVSTGRDNGPARALYERLGFRRLDDVEVVPGLWVTRYRHP